VTVVNVLVTGASGVAAEAVCSQLAQREDYRLRLADVTPPRFTIPANAEFVRCDTRSVTDAQAAVAGCDAVVHLAAWHSGHRPPISDATTFAVNVDGTFNVLQAARHAQVKCLVFASSMAYGWGTVYSVTKVIGEALCRNFQESTGVPTAALRYHEFVPKPYLDFGSALLRNGVDRRDVAGATVAALSAGLERRFEQLTSVVHTDHHMPAEVASNFQRHGPAWLEGVLPGAAELLTRHGISLPEMVEQHDLSSAKAALGWEPRYSIRDFLPDLARRESEGEAVRELWTPADLSVVIARER
jgi:nucleoside-diphosphate-sugar epimerase